MAPLKTNVVRIGNSQGVRIPKTLLEQCHLQNEVELEPRDDYLILRSAKKPRTGWEAAFQAMAKQGDDKMIISDVLPENSWDKDEWEW
ncbi:MAG: AbrB/MazE/SpoVT family DNA-binding domain-containing protein [Thermodesulfobacteriota bacterium]|jgi:antitoxin MazE